MTKNKINLKQTRTRCGCRGLKGKDASSGLHSYFQYNLDFKHHLPRSLAFSEGIPTPLAATIGIPHSAGRYGVTSRLGKPAITIALEINMEGCTGDPLRMRREDWYHKPLCATLRSPSQPLEGTRFTKGPILRTGAPAPVPALEFSGRLYLPTL